MKEAEGRFLRHRAGSGFAAWVNARIEPESSGLEVRCSGSGFKSQGNLEEAPAEGYDDWKAGALAGARYALELAGRPEGGVLITRIAGFTTDTNPTIVGAAAAFAVWEALGYRPSPDEIERIEKLVFASWEQPAHTVPPSLAGSAP
jgi:hypothetical protein